MMNDKKTIGIIGGVGPSAGTDLAKKIFSHTNAKKDQDHINLILVSCPSLIPDRTAYLLNNGENPAQGIEQCMKILANANVDAFGICCNTAHSPKILGQIDFPKSMNFINMIDSTCRTISQRFGQAKIGLLATLGTIQTGIYDAYFEKYPNLTLIKPDKNTANSVHDAIYNTQYGIKATPVVSEQAHDAVSRAVSELKANGCCAVILGCTELPLVFPNLSEYNGTALVDPTDILAVELIRATEPEKLI